MANRRRALKEQRREQVREEILEASQRVLLRRGLSGFTLAAVGRELGLTKAALYYYFDSKEKLVFELVYRSFERHAAFVEGAIEQTGDGPAALEAMIRAAAEFYRDRKDELRLSYLVPQSGGDVPRPGPEELARIRPLNDRLFGSVASRIAADQDAGRVAPELDGRRLAFVAHTAVLGALVMEGHGPMIDEIVAAFVGRLAAPG